MTKLKRWHRPLAGASAAAVLLALTACGGGGDSGTAPPSTIGTLAYVLTECRDTPEGFFEHQKLRIRQGDHEPITVAQPPGVGPIGSSGVCRSLTINRSGNRSVVREAIQAVLVSPDGATVAFEVSDAFSVSPPLPLHIPPELGNSNPSEDCQIFSVDRNGSDLRQLTFFNEAPHSTNGCTFRRGPGCASGLLAQDARTRQLIMTSNCDPPEGTNPDGFQVFAMNPDGSGLQQLTDARGLVQEPDGTVLGELPGPAAYGPYLP